MKDLNNEINKRQINALNKFNADLQAFAPDWVNGVRRESVKKYKNFAEYKQLSKVLKYIEY